MPSSEGCIVRAVVASVLGSGLTLVLLWRCDPLLALVLAPFGGSTLVVAALVLFHVFDRIVPRSAIEPRRDDWGRDRPVATR